MELFMDKEELRKARENRARVDSTKPKAKDLVGRWYSSERPKTVGRPRKKPPEPASTVPVAEEETMSEAITRAKQLIVKGG